jgi:hypothetical protein
MVNPSLTYDNEYNRRLREILTNYDDIEASRNSPTMVTGGIHKMTHINSGNTPYDGREGTAPFSNYMVGGITAQDALHWGKFGVETAIKMNNLRNRGRSILMSGGNRRRNTKEDATFWRDFADSTANSALNLGDHTKRLFGGKGKRANRKEDATFWRDFADSTANSTLNLGDKAKKLFGGNRRRNTKEDATFWRDFADSTVNSTLNLGDKAKKLFGGKGKKTRQILTKGLYAMGDDFKNAGAGKRGGISESDVGQVLRYVPKAMIYRGINRATGNHLPNPKWLGGEKKPRAKSARGAIVSQVMKEHGLSLPQASKYVKEHGLYTR